MATRRLLTGPVGPGSTFTVLSAAAQAAAAGRRFALVLPNRAARDHARNELARQTGACDPRAVFTFVGLARHLLGSRAPQQASTRERDAALARALAARVERAEGDPERELALRFRGLRTGLLRALEEVEANVLTRLRPGRAARAETSADRDRESLERALRRGHLDPTRLTRLAEAFRGYRCELARTDLATEADLLHTAATELPRGNVDPERIPELVLVDGFTDLTLRQRELLHALALRAEEAIVTWPSPGPDATTRAFRWSDRVRAELTGTLGFSEQPRPGDATPDPRPEALRRIARDLLGDAPAEPAGDPTGLRIVRAASRRDEVATALTRARQFVAEQPGRRWTDVLVIVPNAVRYRPLLEEVARELDVPVRVRGPIPLGSAPLVRGALAFARGAAEFDLSALLIAAATPALGLKPDEADRLARAARRRGLPQTSSPELTLELARELGGHAGRFLERAVELGHRLRQALSRARRAALEDGERVTTREACPLLFQSLEERLRAPGLARLSAAPTADEVAAVTAEVAARRDLLALIADLGRLAVPLGGPLQPLPDDAGQSEARAEVDRLAAALVGRIEDEVRATTCRPDDRRRHVVHAVDVREARAWEAELVLVLGLGDRDLGGGGHDDLFLPERTRRALKGRPSRGRAPIPLKTVEDRAAEEELLVYAAMTRARRELWLLWPGFTAGGNPLEPSRYLDAVRELLTPEAWAAACEERVPADVVPTDPDALATEAAVRRFAYRRLSSASRPTGPEAEQVRLASAALDALLEQDAELERATIALHDPRAALAAPLGPAALERVYSASELESFATCPFQHFVRYLLGARPADDLAGSGLNALRQGTVVHGALERVYAHGERPADALAREFERGARALDIAMDEEAFRRQALEAIERFVGEDDPAFRRSTALSPHAFELAFGPDAPAGPLELDAPRLGGKVRLRGKIDRLDVLTDEAGRPAAGFVTDYKLGGREVDAHYMDGLHRGDRLQLSVYLLALVKVLGLKPLGAGFHALGTRRRTGLVEPAVAAVWDARLDERRVRLHRVPLARTLERAEEHIRRLVAGIGQGLIEPSPREAGDCDRCDARDVCRTDRRRARRLARNGQPLPLAAPRP